MLASGQELSARFVLVRRLGTGGSGNVWLAQDNELRRFVAVKILSDELARDGAALAAQQRECERLRKLDHPNILPVHALHRSASHAWIAMEYAAGGDLSQLRGRSCTHILRAAVPIANALAYAHRAGVVHRDVKPANVLLMADGEPRLADFGIALAVAETPPQAAHGSQFNMSPQQLDGEPAAPADDIYAFGALLYELLGGYPPFYPDASPARIRSEPVPPLVSAGYVPAAVTALIAQCLEKSPADRPADMAVIERELVAALDALPSPAAAKAAQTPTAVRIEPPAVRMAPDHHGYGPAGAPGEALRGEWRRSAGTAVAEEELRRQGFRRGIGAAALALGLVGIVVVFFLLPKWVEQSRPAATYRQAAVVVPAAAEPEVEKEPVDFAALARAKQQAEELRAAIDTRVEKLRQRAVEEWGDPEYRQVTTALAQGDEQFTAREFTAAAEQFAQVEPWLTKLEQRVAQVLAAQLQAGARALSEGRSADATRAFEFANRIDAGNRTAARGLQRAGTLDQVLALVTQAEGLEKQGEMTASAEVFRKALALDSEAPRAAQGLARVGAQVAADAFASEMARGLGALAKGEYQQARNAFEAAGRTRPNAPEVAQALKQVEQDERTRVITAKRSEALEFEAGERWADALQVYRAVLQLDSTVAFANEGLARVTSRAQLNEQLEMYLTQPERLFSIPVRNAARKTLEQAAAVADPGPLLQRQIATLRDWVARADSPVQVALQSDNATEVTIHRIGALGTFEQRSLELVPGDYVLVGTRPGYRDVRREISVVPGTPPAPVMIRCEDKI